MSLISQALVKIRRELGCKTSKELYLHLKKRGLECNYQHFVKIEKGVLLPSSILIHQIAAALNKQFGQELILNYCAQLFPTHSYLFELKNDELLTSSKSKTTVTDSGLAKELSYKQVANLALRKENYYLFLILTLSRSPIRISELKNLSHLKKAIHDLESVEIAHVEDDYVHAINTEYRFPKDDLLKIHYDKFDRWDIEFTSDFNFQPLMNKMMTRRISPRYIHVINQQIEALVGLVRLSDEADKVYNSEVLHLQIKMQKGDLRIDR